VIIDSSRHCIVREKSGRIEGEERIEIAQQTRINSGADATWFTCKLAWQKTASREAEERGEDGYKLVHVSVREVNRSSPMFSAASYPR
jgi:hypothetical protein